MSVIPSLLPWHCLVCCEGFGGSDLPSRALHYWQNAIRGTEDGTHSDNSADDWVSYKTVEPLEQPPDYVQAIIEGGHVEPPDKHIRGIVILGKNQGA